MVDFLVALWEAQKVPIRLDAYAPAGSFIAELESRGVVVVVVSPREHAQACGSLFDAVGNEMMRHRVDPALRKAVAGAKDRPMGDAWLWSRTHSDLDISPLVAATLAWGGIPERGKKVAEAHVVLV